MNNRNAMTAYKNNTITMKKTNTNLRVANIIEEGRWGGPQHRILSVAVLLQKQEIETIVVLPEKNNLTFTSKLRESNIPFYNIKLYKLTRNKFGVLLYLINFPIDIWRIIKILKTNEIDLAHCNGASQWKGVIAAKLAGCPACWHLNDTFMPRSVKFIFKLLSKWTVTGFLLSSNRTSSYYLQDKYKQYPRFIIRPPVNCQYFKPIKTPKEINNCTNIISVGNINADKDTETYIRAAQLLNEQFDNKIHCSQIGPKFKSQKNYIAKIEALNNKSSKPEVELLGSQQDIRPFLEESHIFVCSSRAESGPMSVFEAMAMGLPIVSTDVGDISQMNQEGDFAIIVPVGDHVKLAKAIAKLIKSKDEISRLGANARIFAMKELDTTICAENHSIAYKAILSRLKQ